MLPRIPTWARALFAVYLVFWAILEPLAVFNPELPDIVGAHGNVALVLVPALLILSLYGVRCIRLGHTLLRNGVARFHFSRNDYKERLVDLLSKANHSIEIVSISLKVTNDEGRLTDVIRKKLMSNNDFQVAISLANPRNSALLNVISASLDQNIREVKKEIEDMLSKLVGCRQDVDLDSQKRFRILVHESLPIGSVVMIDANVEGRGLIQLETKLYQTNRSESFGFVLSGRCQFFERHFTAWSRVIRDSIGWEH